MIYIDDTWYLKQIPQQAYAYWGHPVVPWMRYVTMLTFLRLNPEWKLTLFMPERHRLNYKPWDSFECKDTYTGRNYQPELMGLKSEFPQFDIHTMSEAELSRVVPSNEMSDIQKSDCLRWYLLGSSGGMWMDTDVIWLKPLTEILINVQENGACNTTLSMAKGIHQIGFIFASVRNKLYWYVWNKVMNPVYARNSVDKYQGFGSEILNREFKSPEQAEAMFEGIKCLLIPNDAIYPYAFHNITKELYVDVPHVHELKERFTVGTIGIHWYGGHPDAGAYQNDTPEVKYKTGKTPISKALRMALDGEEL